MYIDRDKALKHPIAPMTFEVERGRLRSFARVIGLTDPIYFDLDAAKRAGHRDLPAPMTFLSNSLELELPNPFGWLAELGADLTKTTQGEQGFTFYAMAYANDRLIFRRRVIDVYTKKGGALEFVVKQSDVMRGGEKLVEIVSVTVLKHPEAAA